jgi:anti-sigma factor RsiW
VATLLPWYLNGTLTPAETGEVERHLATCASCRAEVEAWRRLRPAVDAAVASRPAPPADLFARVRARIGSEAPAAARPTAATPWWERAAAAVFELLPPRLAPAMALAVIVVQLGALAAVGTVAYRAQQALVVTQSGPEGRRPPAPGAVHLRVAFQESAPEGEIRALLQRLEAAIVDGPSSAGFYIVETPATAGGRPAADALGASPLVRFVERVP